MNHYIGDEPTVIHHETPRSRKAYPCDECDGPIGVGEVYVRQRNRDGSDIWTYRAHVDCWQRKFCPEES